MNCRDQKGITESVKTEGRKNHPTILIIEKMQSSTLDSFQDRIMPLSETVASSVALARCHGVY